jgi:rod shape-determining protein MreD
LPLGGFSLILLAALIWSSISEPEIAAVTGFVAGLFMDLSPSTDGPFGQWTLVLVISCFVISYFGYGDDALNSNPAGLILMTSTAVIATLILYIVIGSLFGIALSSPFNLIKSLIGFGLWSALVAPLIVPFISRAHAIVYSGGR